MALMFPRLARNFAKNGYYPTDEPTLERALNALMPSDGPMCILIPAPAKAWRSPKPPMPSGVTRPRHSRSSSTRSGHAMPEAWSITACTRT